jgi:predicted regulator of Ras-like GTPase activity (Roadblock/LC7/MglB family)
MSFRAILGEIVEGCEDCIGAVLMGGDGIPIEEVGSRHPIEGPLADELGTAGVEFGRILDEIRKASDSLAGGALVETVVVLASFSLLFRPVDDETFLVVVVAADGNLGKARYLMRRHLLAIRQEL